MNFKVVKVIVDEIGETFVVELPWQKRTYVSVSNDRIDDCLNARYLNEFERKKVLTTVKEFKNSSEWQSLKKIGTEE